MSIQNNEVVTMPTLAKKRKIEWDVMMKNAIFEATMAVLGEFGFEGLRMDRVAKAAEVSTGTLYNYFKNKDELLLHVLDTRFEPTLQEFLKIIKSNVSPPEKLEAFVREFLMSMQHHRSLVIIILSAEGLSLPIKTGSNEKRDFSLTILADIIKQGVEQGLFRPFDPLRTAQLIFGAMRGLVQSRIDADYEPLIVESDISECMDLFFSGLNTKG
jgi:AcrR family transcriptional regulator